MTHMPKAAKQGRVRTIQSVDRAVAIIDTLAGCPEGRTLAMLSRELGLKAQTLQSLLRTLQAHDLVVQRERGGPYILGRRLHEWSRRWLDALDLPQAARPAVLAFCRNTREYALLTELHGEHFVGLVEVHADRALAVRSDSHRESLLHVLGTGQAVLAHAEPQVRERLLDGLVYGTRGPKQASDRAKVEQRLARVRRQGYAECIEENAAGIVSLAVPLSAPDGHPAALGTAVPLARYDSARRATLLGALRQTAHEVAEAWGRSIEEEAARRD